MRRFPYVLAVTLLLALAATAGHAADKMDTKVKMDAKAVKGGGVTATLEANERKVQEAFKNKDVDTFMSMVDPDGWAVDPSGITHVSAAVDMMKQAAIKSYTMENFQTYMIDKDACVATYVWKGEGMMGDQPYPPGPWYCSTIWARRGNDWKAVYHQETLAMEPPSAAASN